MKQVLLALILISPMSYADWGETYFCTMTQFVEVSRKGQMNNWKEENFKYQLNEERPKMVFGNSSYFKGLKFNNVAPPIALYLGDPDPEADWIATSALGSTTIFFNGESFLYTSLSDKTIVISADCDSFE